MKSLKLIVLVAFGLSQNVYGQKRNNYYGEQPLKETPAWVTMMEDSTSNYFEAVKTFEDYWKDKEKPSEADENEFKGMSRKEKRKHARFEKEREQMTPIERNNYEAICYQYKRFNNWKNESKPFVQPNGHVLTLFEQQLIWEKQQKSSAEH